MAIDLLSITPHEVSRDLCGYTMLFYGQPKTGKTTICSKFPKTLILAFETGYLAIPGVMVQPIQKWSEFKQVLKQLKDPKVQEMYSNICIDTVDIAYDLCEKYICNQNDIQSIGDLGFGKGYNLAKKEFDESLRAIPAMGYGLLMISHAQDKTLTDENGKEYNKIVPTLANSPRLVVNRMSDIIGYANPTEDEEGHTHTTLFMRGTPRFEAGSRFKYTPDSIPFTYQSLVDAIGDAIDKQAQETDGEYVTDKRTTAHEEAPEIDFEATKAEVNKIIAQIRLAAGDDFKKTWAPRIKEITDKYLGAGNKIADCTATQSEQMVLILDDLKDAVAEGI